MMVFSVAKSYNYLAAGLLIFIIASWFYSQASLHLKVYNNLSIYSPEDIANHNQAIWNTYQGRLLQVNNKKDEVEILQHKLSTNLGDNFVLIFLLIAPFFLFLPHFATFLLVELFFLALSALGVYLVSREICREKKALPLLVALIYFQYFPLTNIAHFFRPEAFSLLFIPLAVYFYLKNYLKLTLLFVLFSLFCREENALSFLALGLISYFFPQKKRFALAITLLCILYLVFAGLSMHYFFPRASSRVGEVYGYLGSDIPEIAKNIFLKPALVVNNFLRSDRIELFNSIFRPLLYLPFFSPVLFLPGLVILGGIMLAGAPLLGNLRWQPWYLCLLIPFVFIALAGAFDKIYCLDAFLAKFKLGRRVLAKASFRKAVKASALIFLAAAFIAMYQLNAKASRFNRAQFQQLLSVRRYYCADMLGISSGISQKAKVISPYRLLPTFSTRQYLLYLTSLKEEIASQGFYDAIILSQDYYNEDLSKFAYLDESPLYQKIYSTAAMRLYVKKDSLDLLKHWKLDLIRQIKSARLEHDYTFTDFIDYTSVLENSGALSPAGLSQIMFRKAGLAYALLRQLPLPDGRSVYLVSDKPIEAGFDYILVFSVTALKDGTKISLSIPQGASIEVNEIVIDSNPRLFALPFRPGTSGFGGAFFTQANAACLINSAMLFRFPLDETKISAADEVFRLDLGKYKISYNPWLRENPVVTQRTLQPDFLIKKIPGNPLLYFMKLFKMSIPEDLYQYIWVKAAPKDSKVVALRY